MHSTSSSAASGSLLRPAAPARPAAARRIGGLLLIMAMIGAAAGFAMVPREVQLIIRNLVLGAGMLVALLLMLRIAAAALAAHRREAAAAIERLIAEDPQAMAIADADGLTLVANDRFRRLTNQAPGPVARALERVFDRDEQALLDFRIAVQRLGGGDPVTAEIPIKAASGMTAWRVQIRALEGRRTAWTLTNVTDRWRRLAAVQEERQRLLEFLDISPSGLFSVDDQGRFVFVNRAMARLLGVPAETLVTGNARLHDVILDRKQGLAPWEALESGTLTQRGVMKLRAHDGREMRVVLDHEILRDSDGGLRTRSVVRPLAEEREVLPRQSGTEPLFEWMFSEAPIGMALLDSSLRLAKANDSFLRLLGMPALTAGQALGPLLRAERRGELTTALQRVLIEGGRFGPVETQPAIESAPPVQLYARRLSADDGSIRGLILHAIDISEQKRLESQVAQSQKMQAVGQLAGGVAHDFNNVLTAISGFAELLLQRHRPGDPSFADLMQIQQNANRAAAMTRQLLAFSRQQTLQPRVVDITETLADFSHLLRRLIGEGIDLRIRHGRDLWPVRADPSQMEQVLMNLVVNARDAMNGRGQLTITSNNTLLSAAQDVGTEVMPAGEYVTVAVADTGAGIPTEVLPRIFEPFFTTKDHGKGTGLGLSTVYGIVRQTDGFVTVESRIGVGTTFTVWLPRHRGGSEDAAQSQAPAPAAAAAVPAGSAAAATGVARPAAPPVVPAPTAPRVADLTGSGTILLVEDEDAVRIFAARALEAKGYTVRAAASGEAALELLATWEGPLDLLITDVIMPEMDGPTLVKQVRETRPDLKVIFISGYAEEHVREELGEARAVNFLSKPFGLKPLAEKVKTVLAQEDPV